MNDRPEYFAARLQDQYPLGGRTSIQELLTICRDRGVAVRWGRLTESPGYYTTLPEPLIVLDRNAPAYVLAHELYHHLVRDLAEWGDDEPLLYYAFNLRGRTQQERDANRFATLLCGEWE